MPDNYYIPFGLDYTLMALETAATLDLLNTSNPAASDGLSQADDHLRLIKGAIKGSFPNFTGALTATQTALDAAVTANTAGTGLHADGTVALPGIGFKDDTDNGWYRITANSWAGAVAGVKVLELASTGILITGTLTPSGQILGANGTVLLPAYSFAGDPNTGVYWIGANNVGIACDGAKVLDIGVNGLAVTGAISATGNVAVTGTFGATGNSTFSGTLGVTGVLTLTSTLTVGGPITVAETAAPSTPASGKGAFYVDTSGNARFINDAGADSILSGIVQRVAATPNSTYTVLSAIPLDDTAPTITEGVEATTLSITPLAATSKIRINFDAWAFGSGSGSMIIAALFRNNVCIQVKPSGANSTYAPIPISYEDAPNSAGVEVVYSVRVGHPTGTTGWLNGHTSARVFGGAAKATMTAEEYIPAA